MANDQRAIGAAKSAREAERHINTRCTRRLADMVQRAVLVDFAQMGASREDRFVHGQHGNQAFQRAGCPKQVAMNGFSGADGCSFRRGAEYFAQSCLLYTSRCV